MIGAPPRPVGSSPGGVCLGKPTDLSETRGFVPIADRQSVHRSSLLATVLALSER